jgi:hypothetical protein
VYRARHDEGGERGAARRGYRAGGEREGAYGPWRQRRGEHSHLRDSADTIPPELARRVRTWVARRDDRIADERSDEQEPTGAAPLRCDRGAKSENRIGLEIESSTVGRGLTAPGDGSVDPIRHDPEEDECDARADDEGEPRDHA